MLFPNFPDGLVCERTDGNFVVLQQIAYNPPLNIVYYGVTNSTSGSTTLQRYGFAIDTGLLTAEINNRCDTMQVGTTTIVSSNLRHFDYSPTSTYQEFDSSAILLGILVVLAGVLVMRIVDSLLEITTW